MTDASFFDARLHAGREDVETVRLPKPQPFAAPVFINDAVTPLAGETVLSILMKRMMDDDQL